MTETALIALASAGQIAEVAPVLRYDVLGILALVLCGVGYGGYQLIAVFKSAADRMVAASDRQTSMLERISGRIEKTDRRAAVRHQRSLRAQEKLRADLQSDFRAIVNEALHEHRRYERADLRLLAARLGVRDLDIGLDDSGSSQDLAPALAEVKSRQG